MRLVLTLASLLVLAAAPARAADTLNAYSIWPENWAKPMFEEFEKATGIHVNFVRFSSGEALARVITEKGGTQRQVPFDPQVKPEVSIGRVQGNDVVLPKGNVSKRHAQIILKEGKFVVRDLKSTNGTYVNGRRIASPVVIRAGDKVFVGDFVLEIEEGAGADLEPPPERLHVRAERREVDVVLVLDPGDVRLRDTEGIGEPDLGHLTGRPELGEGEGVAHRPLRVVDPRATEWIRIDRSRQLLEGSSPGHPIHPSPASWPWCSAYRSSAAGAISS
jgi:pSer/pThr/pTyr-binding forkhead associated (FHA) protein